eukprot:889018-Lingulodinium_polyedra.AAC.1
MKRVYDILGKLLRRLSQVWNCSAYVFSACAKEINSPGFRAAEAACCDPMGLISPCSPAGA